VLNILSKKLIFSRHIIRYVAVFIFCILFIFNPHRIFSVSLALDSTAQGKAIVPQGTVVDVYSFILQSSGQETKITEIKVQNLGGKYGEAASNSTKFGGGITKVSIYRDVNNGGTYSSDDILVKDKEYSSGETEYLATITSISENVPTTDSQRYFIVYDFHATAAAVGSTTNVQLYQVKYQYTVDDNITTDYVTMGGNNNSYTPKISGFATYEAYDISTSIAVPGAGEIAMMRLEFRSLSEDIFYDSSQNLPIKININNPAENFITSTNSTNGIIKAKLYCNVNNKGSEDFNIETLSLYTALDSITSSDGEFTDESNLTFEINNRSDIFVDGVTTNLFVTYDLGEDFQVAKDTQVKGRLASVTGYGYDSGIEIKKEENKPDAGAVEVDVAGLVYSDLSAINTKNSVFSSRTTAPILKFTLTAYNAQMALKSLVINNAFESYNGDIIPFVLGLNNEDGIKKVFLYEDNNNGDLDVNDTLLATLQLSDIGLPSKYNDKYLAVEGNDKSQAVVTFNYDTGGGVYSDTITLSVDTEKQFLLVYEFGNNVEDGASGITASFNISSYRAIARLNGALGYATPTSNQTITVNLSGTLPAAAYPEAQIYIVESKLSVINVSDISPSTVVRGQVNIPMLYAEIDSESSLSDLTVNVYNSKGTFTSDAQGVNKASIYRDNPTNDVYGTFGSEDTLLGANNSISDRSSAAVSGVSLSQDTNRIFICYDIGQNAALQSQNKSYGCQIKGITGKITSGSSATDISLAGYLEAPKEPAVVEVDDKKIEITSVEGFGFSSADTITGEKELYIKIKNVSSEDIEIQEIIPRFYLSEIEGRDISSEFSSDYSSAYSGYRVPNDPRGPFILTVGSAEYPVRFTISHSTAISDGEVCIDGYVKYAITATNSAVVTRYKSSDDWYSAAENQDYQKAGIDSTQTQYSFSLPDYIDKIEVQVQGQANTPFVHGDSIKASSTLLIYFKNNGSIIDEASITLTLGGTTLSHTSGEPTSTSFSYDRDNGLITVKVGSADDTLVLSANDLEGGALLDSNISFSVSNSIKIESALFYPSPYHIGVEDLYLGLNLTQPATVKIYLFNYLGTNVWKYEEYVSEIGYKIITIDKLESFLSSGMYVCKILAEDDDGNKDMASTKLVIY
jgi:hypothetical protein